MEHQIVSQDEWLAARRELLKKEKEFTRLRDKMTEQIRALPWRKIEKAYSFTGPKGKESLLDLFDGKTQLAVYHFMLGPDWEQGCKSCSYWADGFQGIPIHLAHRDVSFVVVSRAPLSMIDTFKKRMGWNLTCGCLPSSQISISILGSRSAGKTNAQAMQFTITPMVRT